MSFSLKNLMAGAIALGLTIIPALAQSKVGTINIQQAIISTKDGQKAAAELQNRFDPKRKEIEKNQAALQSKQQQLQKMGTVGSEDAKRKLSADIEADTKRLQRDTEDAQAEWDQEQQKTLNELGGRIMQVINKYATDNGYSMILDISSQQTPVIWASNTVDITNEVIKLYDSNAPSTVTTPKPAAAAPATTPAKTPAAPAKK
ncbi:OmpH family outer membrane protein [Bryobacter aggregatus]|uniref:OmpH family outer membrane protein n=1 Tax=Bryobacter aggregatus TaxID=360054 RepID=UPI0004E20737|nr:OmpH family outer membrane protein [Bryobacter aggregatus]